MTDSSTRTYVLDTSVLLSDPCAVPIGRHSRGGACAGASVDGNAKTTLHSHRSHPDHRTALSVRCRARLHPRLWIDEVKESEMASTSKTSEANHHRIVVAVDGSPAARVAADWAARDAALRRVPLTVVHAAGKDLGQMRQRAGRQTRHRRFQQNG